MSATRPRSPWTTRTEPTWSLGACCALAVALNPDTASAIAPTPNQRVTRRTMIRLRLSFPPSACPSWTGWLITLVRLTAGDLRPRQIRQWAGHSTSAELDGDRHHGAGVAGVAGGPCRHTARRGRLRRVPPPVARLRRRGSA